MNKKQGLARSASIRSAVQLCCLAFALEASALAQGNPKELLHVDGGAVSADIRAKPLVEVARALERQTGVTIHFPALQGKEQVITVRFKKLALVAALRAIFENTNYAIVTGPTEQGGGIQVYVYPKRPGDAAKHSPVTGAPAVSRPASDPAPQSVGIRPEEPMELPAP